MVWGIATGRDYEGIDAGSQPSNSPSLSLDQAKKIAQAVVDGHFAELATNAKGFCDPIKQHRVDHQVQNVYGTFGPSTFNLTNPEFS